MQRYREISGLGASVLYLPSYSPDLNPIEQFFSKLKALLRQAAERTIPNLCRRIRLLLRTVCPEECTNFLRQVPPGMWLEFARRILR